MPGSGILKHVFVYRHQGKHDSLLITVNELHKQPIRINCGDGYMNGDHEVSVKDAKEIRKQLDKAIKAAKKAGLK